MAITVDYVSDWAVRLKTRLYTQFRNAVTWQEFCDLLGAASDDIELAAQSLFSLPDIDDSSGAQLDLIGRIIGQPRIGSDDATYRIYLKARVLANKSCGTSEDIYGILRALYGESSGFLVRYSGTKTFEAIIETAIDRSDAFIGLSFLRDSKESGARGLLRWQESADSAVFTFDSGPGFDVGKFAAALQA